MEEKDILKKWEEKNKYFKGYVHFDCKKNSFQKGIKEYITDEKNIVKHSFYPFISTEIKFKKYRKKVKDIKIRKIKYSAHMDRLIFSYYSHLLNYYYNSYAIKNKINESIIAYRDNFYGKSNINFANDVFKYMLEVKTYFVMIGDFSNFFENLDHNYLKDKICKVLTEKKLKDDWYVIFKNITNYSYCELENILKIKNITRKELMEKDRIFTPKEFRKYRKNGELKIKINENINKKLGILKGIPQGSAISAVLANVYMIEFDRDIIEYLKKYNGRYYRYSDDFIIIVPLENLDIQKIKNEIQKNIEELVKEAKLDLKKEKTKTFIYNGEKLQGSENTINYLGFSFDGENIYLRDKTLTKFYHRMYKKIKTINKNKGITQKGNIISKKILYKKYSIKGVYIKNKNIFRKEEIKKMGNFLSYVIRAEKIFGKKYNKNIKHIRKVNMKKIKGKLEKFKIIQKKGKKIFVYDRKNNRLLKKYE